MRKILLAIILFISGISYAFHFEGVGNRTFIDNDGDTLFIFATTPEFESKIGPIDWYRLPDTTKAFTENAEEFTLAEHGEGYAIKVNGAWEYFWVFEYEQLRPQVNGVEAILSCTETVLDIDGTVPTIQYTDTKTKLQTVDRLCTVTYMDAMWGENDWVDSVAVMETELTNSIVVGASPVATDFVIVDPLATELGLADSIVTETDIYQPMAIKTHPQAIVTTRGKENDRSNEVERPVDAETLIRRSAPLEVEFKANGLNAEYYQWNIYKGTELYLQRSEAQHRYTFTEPGNYRVMLGASNSYDCAIDSVQFDISVSESMLTVPNVFTPNGDGHNDEFRVVYRSIKEFHMWVYNRWGKLVYKSDEPAKGWDGNIGGRPAAEGAYYYVIRALGTDAESGYMSKPAYSKKIKNQELPIGVYQLSGDINLLR